MKKSFYLVGCLVLTVLLVTGCGSEKKLECTMTGEESGIKNDQKVNVTFKGDKATVVSLDMKMTVPEEATAYISLLKSTLEEQFAEFNKDKDSKIDITTNNNEIRLNLTANIENMKDAEKTKLGITSDKSTFNDVKESFEGQGYTCK